MFMSPKNKGQKENLDGEGNDNTFMPIVGDIRELTNTLYEIVDDTNEYSVKTKYYHCADGYIYGHLESDSICTAP